MVLFLSGVAVGISIVVIVFSVLAFLERNAEYIEDVPTAEMLGRTGVHGVCVHTSGRHCSDNEIKTLLENSRPTSQECDYKEVYGL